MEVRIGIADNSQTIAVTLGDDIDRDELKTTLDDALKGDSPVLWLTDKNGGDIVFVSSKITHVEIVSDGSHAIGFG